MTRLNGGDRNVQDEWKNIVMLLQLAAILALGSLSAHAQTHDQVDAYSVPEPPNLGILQDSVRSYINSGAYERGIAQVINSARSYIKSHYSGVSKPAIVLDIDETSLSNIEFEYRYSFGYNPSLWNSWVKQGAATAIKPTLELAKWAAQNTLQFSSSQEESRFRAIFPLTLLSSTCKRSDIHSGRRFISRMPATLRRPNSKQLREER